MADDVVNGGVSSLAAGVGSGAGSGAADGPGGKKLHGREFYESLGSPRVIVAPMVDRSEFAWRMLARSFADRPLLAYSPMFHARLFKETPAYRQQHFEAVREQQPSDIFPTSTSTSTSISTPTPASEQKKNTPHLDGNPSLDRPLIVQFCANDPTDLLEAARRVEPFCDAVDLNLGCPQGIARRGRYGAFLQEEPAVIHALIRTLHDNLSVPVTAKFRVRDTRAQTLEYARLLLDAGASILAVHGRTREQKGHNTGLADWGCIRYLRENLPADTVIFANGNVLGREDVEACLAATGADGVMSAEACLSDPTVFSRVPVSALPGSLGDEVGSEESEGSGGSGAGEVYEVSSEYWRGRDGRGGYRMDFIMRRYLDIIYEYVLREEKPARAPLFVPSGAITTQPSSESSQQPQPQTQENKSNQPKNDTPDNEQEDDGEPPTKKQKRSTAKPNKKEKKDKKKNNNKKCTSPNLTAMQGHLFQLLRPLITTRTTVRDALARARGGDIPAFEEVLHLVERAVREGMVEYEAHPERFEDAQQHRKDDGDDDDNDGEGELTGSRATIAKYARPWWVCQPHIRPLPEEALASGAMQLRKSEKRKLEMEAVAKKMKDENGEDAAAAGGGGGEGNGEKSEIGTPQGELVSG